jgi:hypothetical protein
MNGMGATQIRTPDYGMDFGMDELFHRQTHSGSMMCLQWMSLDKTVLAHAEHSTTFVSDHGRDGVAPGHLVSGIPAGTATTATDLRLFLTRIGLVLGAITTVGAARVMNQSRTGPDDGAAGAAGLQRCLGGFVEFHVYSCVVMSVL